MRPERITTDPGANAAKYSANTRGTTTWYDHRNKKCAGPCRTARSMAQFAEGDDLCAKCRRRAA